MLKINMLILATVLYGPFSEATPATYPFHSTVYCGPEYAKKLKEL
jgi:hypothetical protein